MSEWLPELVLKLEGESSEGYTDRVCDLFCNDFLSNAPRIAGYTVKLMVGSDVNGRKRCFWHLITSGDGLEEDRDHCDERCERILWIRAIIKRYGTTDVRWWKKLHKGRLRLLMSLPDFSYLIALDVKKEQQQLILISAYPIDRPKRRVSLQKEYEAMKDGS